MDLINISAANAIYFLIKSEKVTSVLLRALRVAKYRSKYDSVEAYSWFVLHIFSSSIHSLRIVSRELIGKDVKRSGCGPLNGRSSIQVSAWCD